MILNYVATITQIKFTPYICGSVVGMVPDALVNIYRYDSEFNTIITRISTISLDYSISRQNNISVVQEQLSYQILPPNQDLIVQWPADSRTGGPEV